MSGCSDTADCPNCGNQALRYVDWKPFDYISLQCEYCGFETKTVTNYMTLEELNDFRAERELQPLKELPKQNKELIWE